MDVKQGPIGAKISIAQSTSETFDHWVRDEAEMYRIIEYIEQNPVKAGLVERREDWLWSSARGRSLAGTKVGEPIVRVE